MKASDRKRIVYSRQQLRESPDVEPTVPEAANDPQGQPEAHQGRPKGARTRSTPAGADATDLQKKQRSYAALWATVFLVSLLFPIRIHAGPVLLFPYRLWLLILFVPLFMILVTGRAGRMILVDWLMLGAAIWGMLALAVNQVGHGPIDLAIEPAGVYMLESFGAYMLGRVAIRSQEDFIAFVRKFFLICLVLLPFAMLESVTRTPVMLSLIGERGAAVDAGIRMGLRRAQTVFEHPILFGAFASTGLGLVWYALFPEAGVFRRALVTLVIIATSFFSLSTGAMFAMVMQLVFITWELVTRPYRYRWRVFAAIVIGAYVLIDQFTTKSPFHLLVNYASFSSGSAYNRIRIWDYGMDNVWANPVFGLGLNSVNWVRPSWMSASVDNFWLNMTLNYGIPCFLMLSLALILTVKNVSRFELTDARDRACRAAYLTAFGGLVVAGSTVHYWKATYAFIMFFFGTAIWIFTGGAKTDTQTPAAPTASRGSTTRGPSSNRAPTVRPPRHSVNRKPQ